MNKWFTLFAMSFLFAVFYFNTTSVVVSLATIQQELNLPQNQLHWIVNAYALALAIFLMVEGHISTHLKMKSSLYLGQILFLAGSFMCAAAPDSFWILLGRALQGTGSAFILPSTIMVLTNVFPPQERGKAMGTYHGAASIVLPVGSLAGGLLTTYLGWRSIFIVECVMAIISIGLIYFSVPSNEVLKKEPVNRWSLFFVSIGVASFVTGIMQGKSWGWLSLSTVSLFIIGVVFLFAFIRINQAAKHPFLDFKIFNNQIAVFALIVICSISAIRSVQVFWAIFLQQGFKISPAWVGIALLPAILPLPLFGTFIGHLVDRYGSKRFIYLGALAGIVGIGCIIFGSIQKELWINIAGFLLFGCMIALTFIPTMVLYINNTLQTQRRKASGISQLLAQIFNATGFAAMAAVLISVKDPSIAGTNVLAFNITMLIPVVILIFILILTTKLPSKSDQSVL